MLSQLIIEKISDEEVNSESNVSKNKIIIFQNSKDKVTNSLEKVLNGLNKICSYLKFEKGKTNIEILDKFISKPQTHEIVYSQIFSEHYSNHKNILINLFITNKPYDNNYFSNQYKNIGIISFFDWNYLTDLSKKTG